MGQLLVAGAKPDELEAGPRPARGASLCRGARSGASRPSPPWARVQSTRGPAVRSRAIAGEGGVTPYRAAAATDRKGAVTSAAAAAAADRAGAAAVAEEAA